MGLCSCLGTILVWILTLAANTAVLLALGMTLVRWENWKATLAGSVVYLVALVIITGRYRARVMANAAANTVTMNDAEPTNEDDSSLAESKVSEQTASTTTGSARSRRRTAPAIKIPLGLSLMSFLTNLIWAVPGALVAFFAFPCGDIDPSMAHHQVYWKTNMTELPADVQQWVENFAVGDAPSPTMAHTTTDNIYYVYATTLQDGNDDNAHPQLYAITDVASNPIPLGYEETLQDLVALDDSGTVCFVHYTDNYMQSHLTCGAYGRGFVDLELPRNRHSFGLTSINGLLWFLQIRSDYYILDPLHGGGSCNFKAVTECDNCFLPACRADTMHVWSLNATTMDLVSHSTRVTTRARGGGRRLEETEDVGNDDDASTNQEDFGDDEFEEFLDSDLLCDGQILTRLRSFGALFLSALPMIISCARAWIGFAIPSASVTLFTSIGYAFFCAWGVFAPDLAPVGFRVWMLFGTPVWLLVCTYQVVVNPRVSKPPLWWSLYLITTGLVLLLVIQEYFEFYNVRVMDGHEITVWLMDIIMVHLPLLVIAILTKSIYISLLTITAFLLLTSMVVWRMTDTMSDTMIVGGSAYACILLLAIIIYCFRDRLNNMFVKTLSAIARHTCAIEVADNDEEETEHTEGLLTAEENDLL